MQVSCAPVNASIRRFLLNGGSYETKTPSPNPRASVVTCGGFDRT
jgi:hypothetical protein